MNRFKETYLACLKQASSEHPDEYWWTEEMVIHGNTGNTVIPKSTVEDVASKMFAAIERRSFNKEGRAFKMTCKKLGIPYTYAAIISAYGETE